MTSYDTDRRPAVQPTDGRVHAMASYTAEP